MTDPVALEVLPAGHGDALVLTYGGGQHRLLIDGGPAYAYEEGLGRHIRHLDPDARSFELFVVTHVDADHIDGALILLRERDRLGVSFGDVWFNGWEQIVDSTDPDRGALQGEYFTDLLRAVAVKSNQAFDGRAVVSAPDERLRLPGGAELTLLSPAVTQLGQLRRTWVRTVERAGFAPGSHAEVASRLEARGTYRPPADEAVDAERGGAARKTPGSDRAVANGSSIAALFQFGGRRVLLGADAHTPVLLDALDELKQRWRTPRIGIDLFKLPHHGSVANVSEELLRRVRCGRFVVSTNGQYFGHPDAETIELLGHVARDTGESPPEVFFNYLCSTTERWADPAEQARAGIRAVFPTADGPGIRIDF